jgi:magnesium and cobalt transporter
LLTKTYKMESNTPSNKFKKFIPSFFKKDKNSLLKSLQISIDLCKEAKLLSLEESKMMNNIIDINETKVGNIMTPRTDIVAISNHLNLDEIQKIIIEKEHSRIIVYKENLDQILGFIHSKDLLKFIGRDVGKFKVDNITRKILFVPESMKVTDLLLKMRSSRLHIAVILDEYGGTNGIITFEDVVEEIVGEIEDEHDVPDVNIYNSISTISENKVNFGGRVEIKKVEEMFNVEIVGSESDDNFDTVGGFVFSIFKKVPENDEKKIYSDILEIKILSADKRSIKLAQITKLIPE